VIAPQGPRIKAVPLRTALARERTAHRTPAPEIRFHPSFTPKKAGTQAA